jgi:hypothetical protein
MQLLLGCSAAHPLQIRVPMDNHLVRPWSVRPPIAISSQSMLGVLVLTASGLAVFGLLFFAATLLLSAVTVPGVVLGVLGVLGAKLLFSCLAAMVQRAYQDGVVDPSAMARAVDRMVAPALEREAACKADAAGPTSRVLELAPVRGGIETVTKAEQRVA